MGKTVFTHSKLDLPLLSKFEFQRKNLGHRAFHFSPELFEIRFLLKIACLNCRPSSFRKLAIFHPSFSAPPSSSEPTNSQKLALRRGERDFFADYAHYHLKSLRSLPNGVIGVIADAECSSKVPIISDALLLVNFFWVLCVSSASCRKVTVFRWKFSCCCIWVTEKSLFLGAIWSKIGLNIGMCCGFASILSYVAQMTRFVVILYLSHFN